MALSNIDIGSLFNKKKNEKIKKTSQNVKKTSRNENENVLRSYKVSQEVLDEQRKQTERAFQSSDKSLLIEGLDAAKSVIDDAAIYYSNGEHKKATELLIKRLNNVEGKVDKQEWYMILDSYQSTDQQVNFEKLADLFSKFWNISPPAWDVKTNDNANKDVMGRSNLNIDGSISELKIEKLKDFFEATKISGSCRIDFSRAKILFEDEEKEEKIEHLLNTMIKIKKNKFKGLIMGDSSFIDSLLDFSTKVRLGNNIKDEYKVYWLMLCELYQWHGLQDNFEDVALEYALLFKCSPPSFDENQTMQNTSVLDDSDLFFIEKNGLIETDRIIDRQNIDKLMNLFETSLENRDEINFNLKYIQRIDYYSATVIAEFLNQKSLDKNKVFFNMPIEIIITLFDITGVSNYVTYIPRKR